MKVTIKTTVEHEFEVKVPCFVRTKYFFYKVFSDKHAISVFNDNEFPAIQVVSIGTAFSGDWAYCNASDFANAYENMMFVIEEGAYSEVRQEVEDDSN
jgi:hypothetical protein